MSAVGNATECFHVVYGGHRIDFMIVRRRRKTLEIAVEPDASVVVAAPVDASIEAIAEKVLKRAAWVRRQQRFFSQFMPRTPERRYLARETHLYLGRQYRLKVVRNGRPRVEMTRGFITAYTREAVFPESFGTRTVQQMGWAGCSNGELLRHAEDHGFDILVTVDQGGWQGAFPPGVRVAATRK